MGRRHLCVGRGGKDKMCQLVAIGTAARGSKSLLAIKKAASESTQC